MVNIYPLANLPLMKAERVVKYKLVWCESGTLVMEIDNRDYHLSANSVVTITSGQIHGVKMIEGAKGLVLEFTYDYFCKKDSDVELIFHNGLFCHFGMNEVIQLKNPYSVGRELRQIEKELDQQPYQFLLSVHSRIELALIAVNRTKLLSGGDVYRPDALFLKFLDLVISQSNHAFSTGDAARKLGTTVLKLNELSKLHTGKTAQSVIYSLLILESKRLLTYDQLPVKEVAYRLGFADPFYFSNFFKKQTGCSPKEYSSQIAP